MRASMIYAPPMALATTLALLLLMYSLISTDYQAPPQEPPSPVETVVMPERQPIEPILPEPPARPDSPDKAPQAIPEPAARTGGGSSLSVTMPGPAANPQGTGLKLFAGGDLMPLIKVAPEYPRRALARGVEGYVTVSYTVTETGRTANVVVLEAVTKDGEATSIFDRAAVAAAEQFKYEPRVEDGQPVPVYGVRNRFVFELD